MSRTELGAFGEQVAVDHLVGHGWAILARNWRCRYGELDVIAAERLTCTVVFVEVKTRTGDGFGGLSEAVTTAKVQRIRRLAGLWLSQQDRRWAALRIDVLQVRLGGVRAYELTHLKGVG